MQRPSTSRRATQRHQRRVRHWAVSLEVFVGLCTLTGPRDETTTRNFHAITAPLQRRLRRLWRTTSVSVPKDLPTWAKTVFRRCEISRHESHPAVWLRSQMAATCYCRPLSGRIGNPAIMEDALAHVDDFIHDGNYTLSKATTEKTFRKIDPARLALPPPNHKPVDASNVLRWPYSELFSPLRMASYLRTPEELAEAGPMPRCRVSLEDGAKYSDVLTRFLESGMLKVVPARLSEGGPINGLFAVEKPNGSLRPIIDARAGNHLFCKARFQTTWEEILASRPERTAEMRLTASVQDMPTPATMTQYPDGAFGAKLTDKGSFFYTLLTLKFLVRYQRLPRIWGEELGLGPGWFDVYILVMAMGNWLSAALAHLIHVEIMWRLARGPILLREPSAQPVRRQRAYALAERRSTDGFLRVDEVPSSLASELKQAGHPGFELAPRDLLVPVDAFRLEIVDKLTLKRSGGTCIELHTSLVRVGPDARRELAEAHYRANRSKCRQILALVALYCDDNTGIYYDTGRPEDLDGSQTPCIATATGWAAARLQTLLTIVTSLDHGFIESWKKLRWPSAAPGKALGVQFSFGPGGRMRWEVDPARRFASRELRLAISRSQAEVVTEEVFDNAVGNLVWEQLCHRSFLSINRVIYAARHSKHRPAGGVYLSPDLRQELWLSAMLSPCYVSETTTISKKLTTYDASGKTAQHNGGFGVAFRYGLDPLTASELMTTKKGQLGRLSGYAEPSPGQIPLDRGKTAASRIACVRASQLLRFNWEQPKGAWIASHRGCFKISPAYIAIGESGTGLLAARGTSKRVSANTKENLFLLGGDNTVACTCFDKGRSSTRALNVFGRRMAVTEFVRGVYFAHFWLPSKSNPSDGPSRWFYEDKRPRTRAGRLRRAWVRDLWMDGDVHPHPGPLFDDLQPKKRRTPRHPFKGRHVVVAPRAERVKARGPHSLAALKQGDASLGTYLSAFDGLTAFIKEKGHKESSYARAVAAYVNEGFNTGAFSRDDAQTAVTACGFFRPEIKAAGQLKLAGQYLAAWKKMKPVKSHRPVPKHVNELLCLRLLQQGSRGAFHAGIAGLLGFSTYARSCEIRNLRDLDVRRPEDEANFLSDRGTAYLRKTKAGVPQAVVLDDPWINMWLDVFVALKGDKHATAESSMFDFGKKSFLEWYKWAQQEIGYSSPPFVGHSLRHGGATHDHMSGHRNVSGIKIRGRWKSYAALQVYLQAMQANLAAEELPDKARAFFAGDTLKARRLLTEIAKRLASLLPARP